MFESIAALAATLALLIPIGQYERGGHPHRGFQRIHHGAFTDDMVQRPPRYVWSVR